MYRDHLTMEQKIDMLLDHVLRQTSHLTVDVLAGVKITLSQGADKRWFCYVSLPKRITQRPEGWWTYDSVREHYWMDARGKTPEEAIQKAMKEGIGNALFLLLGNVLIASKEIKFEEKRHA